MHKETKSKENLCTSYVHANALEQNKNVYRKEVVRQEKLMQRVVDIIMCTRKIYRTLYSADVLQHIKGG